MFTAVAAGEVQEKIEKLNNKTKPICFQIIDWHQEDVLQNDEDSDSSYDSDGDKKTKYK